MFRLALLLFRASGRVRLTLLIFSSAVVSWLQLVAIWIYSGAASDETLLPLVRDPSTSGGVAFAMLLVAIPPVLFFDQTARLGSARRNRRLAAIRLIGASRVEIRLLGAIETGLPAAIGAALGIGGFLLARKLLPGYASTVGPWTKSPLEAGSPGLQHLVLVLLATCALGAVIGWKRSRITMRTHAATNGRQRRPTLIRQWTAPPLLAAVLVFFGFRGEPAATLGALILISIFVTITVMVAPLVARWEAIRRAESTSDAPTFIAARRVADSPESPGRASAAIGGIGLVSGGAAGVLFGIQSPPASPGSLLPDGGPQVILALLIALAFSVGSMALHTIETLEAHSREVAYLAAAGMTDVETERTARAEITLVSLPLAIGTSALGAAVVGVFGQGALVQVVLVTVLAGCAVGLAVWSASILAVRSVRPWVRRATSPLNLRTE